MGAIAAGSLAASRHSMSALLPGGAGSGPAAIGGVPAAGSAATGAAGSSAVGGARGDVYMCFGDEREIVNVASE